MEFIRPAELREIIALPLFSDLVQCGFPSPALFPSDICCQSTP
ncbi:TPA: SOS mutagenesis error-prone repair protein [Enterobacter hormaechei subsp. xiangfangensis]|nr:SOS mutagenesis error-prone repair protein [Enterobacter hormaechei subsp. xiangfangensis]